MAERYLVAAFAFMAAATWLGVSLTGGFACLFVFVLAVQAVRLYQRRGGSRTRRASSRRERPSRHAATAAEHEDVPPRPARERDRSRPPARVYDGDREHVRLPVASDATW